jgi:hypothetical protein
MYSLDELVRRIDELNRRVGELSADVKSGNAHLNDIKGLLQRLETLFEDFLKAGNR